MEDRMITIKSKLKDYAPKVLPVMDKHLKWYVLLLLIGFPLYFEFVKHSIFQAVFAFIVFSPLALTSLIKKLNIMTTSIFVLFAVPISISFSLMCFLNWIFPSLFTNLILTYYYLGSIPMMSIAIFFYFVRKEERFLEKVKVSLEYNNCVYILILFTLLVYSYSVNDFSKLLPTVSPDTIKSNSVSDLRELASLFFQVASFPFLIANGILKSFVEHLSFKKGLKNL
jgi:hypothetical protein